MIQHGCKHIPRFLTGIVAMVLAIYFILHQGSDLVILLASSFLLFICITDTLYSKIPNLCNLALIISGFSLHIYLSGWAGAGTAFLGLLCGLGLFLVPHLLGGMGAGDVKALAAMGALLGPGTIFQVFLYTAVIGGVLGVLHYLFASNIWTKLLVLAGTFRTERISKFFKIYMNPGDSAAESLRFPYAAAIAFGFFAYVQWGGIFKLIA